MHTSACVRKKYRLEMEQEKTGALGLYNLTLFKLRMYEHSPVTHIAVAENGHNFT
jgi:hypothetical protein